MSSTGTNVIPRIGDALIAEGIITPEQLDHALAAQCKTGQKLGVILEKLGIVTQKQITECLTRRAVSPSLVAHINELTMDGYSRLDSPVIEYERLIKSRTLTHDLLDASVAAKENAVIHGVARLQVGQATSLPFSFSINAVHGVATIESLDVGGLKRWVRQQELGKSASDAQPTPQNS